MMRKEKEKDQPWKKRPLTRLLLLWALIVPLLNDLILGVSSRLLKFYGGVYSYSVGGVLLTLLSEIFDVLYTVISCAALTGTVMTVGFCAAKKGIGGGIVPALFSLLCALLSDVLRIAEQTLLLALGVSDSTVPVSEQILPGIATFLVSFLLQWILLFLLFAIFAAVGKKSGRNGLLLSEKTAYMVTVYIFIGVYTLLMLADAVPLALAYTENENLFTGVILPFVYPLIYGILMLLTALRYREVLQKNFEK